MTRAWIWPVLLVLVIGTHATRAAASDFSKDPVFFVHGHGLSSSSWTALTAVLRSNGYPSEFLRAIDLHPKDGANQPAAEGQLAPAIEAFLTSVNSFLTAQGYAGPPKTRVDLVSHSMGGLSSRWYATQIAPERVDMWISIAGANHGTNALCPFVGDGGSDDSCPAYSIDAADRVQLILNGQPFVADVDETPYGPGADPPGVDVVPPDATRRIVYFTVRVEPDIWIDPNSSTVVDGAGGLPVALPGDWPFVETSAGNYRITKNVGHDAMPRDPDVMALVNLLLATTTTTMKTTTTIAATATTTTTTAMIRPRTGCPASADGEPVTGLTDPGGEMSAGNEGNGSCGVADACFLNVDTADLDDDNNSVLDICECTAQRPGRCLAGGGSKKTDCLLEFNPSGPIPLNRGGTRVRRALICRDGDPACDRDGAADGQCTFGVTICVANSDPRFPRCTPSEITSIEVLHPRPGGRKPSVDRENAIALEQALGTLGVEIRRRGRVFLESNVRVGLNSCSHAVKLVTPAPKAEGGKPVRRRFRLLARAVDGRRDRDKLILKCKT